MLVRLKRFELLTHGLEGRCSIQLSYRRVTAKRATRLRPLKMERVMGIGPTRPAWKAGILPLNYTRISSQFTAASTTLVYNSTIQSNCQTLFAVFCKFFRKNLIYFSCANLMIRTGENFARKCKTCCPFACLILKECVIIKKMRGYARIIRHGFTYVF